MNKIACVGITKLDSSSLAGLLTTIQLSPLALSTPTSASTGGEFGFDSAGPAASRRNWTLHTWPILTSPIASCRMLVPLHPHSNNVPQRPKINFFINDLPVGVLGVVFRLGSIASLKGQWHQDNRSAASCPGRLAVYFILGVAAPLVALVDFH